MNMKKLTFYLILSFLFSTVLFAGNKSKSGTTGAEQLLIPVGAKMIALSGTAVASVSGIEALYWNPAGVSSLTGNSEIMFFRGNGIADIGLNYFGGGFSFDDIGVFSFAIKSLDFGEIVRTTDENTDGGFETFSPTYMTMTVGYSNRLTDKLNIGVSFNIISEKIIRTSATGFSLDAGIQFSNFLQVHGLSIGLVLKNFGPSMKYSGADLLVKTNYLQTVQGTRFLSFDSQPFDLPTTFLIGMDYSQSFDSYNAVIFSGVYENNSNAFDTYRGGLEYTFNDLFFVRGSYTMTDGLNEAYTLWGSSFGVGINYDLGAIMVKVDYAYRVSKYFGGLNQVGLTLGL